jgi:hypothetical protein
VTELKGRWLPVGRTPGVGKVTEARMGQVGIKMVGDIHVMDLRTLEGYFGRWSTRQYLLPCDYLELYGPADGQWAETDPRKEDNKEDFQKQNVHDFRCADTWVARGWATTHTDSNPDDTGTWAGPFLFLSYRGGPGSKRLIFAPSL